MSGERLKKEESVYKPAKNCLVTGLGGVKKCDHLRIDFSDPKSPKFSCIEVEEAQKPVQADNCKKSTVS